MTDAADDKLDFFVSYNRADQAWAEWIAWELHQAGYSVVIQAWHFRPGHNFVLEMQKAAAQAERVVAVLSPDYLEATYTHPEWASGFARDPTGERRVVVPIRVAPCELKGLLPQIIYIDFVSIEVDTEARARLFDGLKPPGPPDRPPPFPRGRGRQSAPLEKRESSGEIVPLPRRSESARFPGALPPIWNLPHLRNPHFTGREELLDALHWTLIKGPTALTALSGMGGIGKTQMALEYAYRHHSECDLVWWLRAEEPAILLADYAALADALDLAEAEERELAAVAQAVRRTLEKRARWLLVFDNARNEDDLRDLLPRGSGGRVLITSRNPSWNRATALEVPLLVRASSVAFLLKRTGQGDETTAAALAAELGDLPLALEQAAAFIVRRAMPLVDYLAAFRAQREELWKREKPPHDYPDTVRTTWNLSAAQLKQEEPGAIDLLNLGAFLAPEAIPYRLLSEHRGTLPLPLSEAAADSLRWGDFVEALRSYSLVGVVDGTITFHRLVQAATRDALPAEDRRTWTEVAVRLVNAALPCPPQEHANWPTIGALLPHALVTSEAAERLEADLETAATVLNQIALYHKARATYTEAEPLYQRALAIDENALGPEHPDVAIRLNNLAELYRATGRYDEAEPLLKRALAIREKTLGLEHPDVAQSLNNLALLYRVTGRYDEAEPLLKHALKIYKTTPGEGHPHLATGLNNLASLYRDTRRYAKAEPLYQRALAIREKTLGLEHPDVAQSLNNLAELYRVTRRYAEAEPLLKRALKIYETTPGEGHPHLANALNNLASLYRDTRRYAKAEPLYQRALAIYKMSLGKGHSFVATSLNNLALLYHATGRTAEAEPLFQRALKIYEKARGERHPDLASGLNSLASLYRDTGRHAEAEPLLKRALAILERTLPPDHPDRMQVRENYARLLDELGRPDDASAVRAQDEATG